MKRLLFPLVLVGLASVAAFVLAGCGRESSSAEREERRESAAERGQAQGSSPEIELGHVGEVVEVGPLLVRLNDAEPYTSGDQGEGGARQIHYYVVVDITLENGAQTSFDTSDVNYLLRDEEGYSFKRKTIPDQKPPPEGQVMPAGKASGQVAFDLGTEPVGAPLTLFVSLPDVEGASQGIFEFEVKHETQKKPPPDTSAETGRATGPDYDLVEGPTGGLTVEVPASWEVQTGANSEGEGSNWSYYVGASLTSSITTAPSLDTWYSTGSSGAYMVASKELAQYSDYELTHSMLFANRAENCAATGPYEDYNRLPYSGKMQTWYDCGQDGATTYAVTAAPEGRECVAVFDMRVSDEAHREAVQHILNSFKLDCGLVISEPRPSPSASATSSASASSPASDTPEASPSRDASEDLDCRDFASGAEAQAALEDNPNDPHNLDADSDGLACEESSFADPSTTDSSAPPSSPPSPSPDSREPSPGSGSGRDLDCDDFSSQEEAQEMLEDDPSDPHGLDADNDGEACED